MSNDLKIVLILVFLTWPKNKVLDGQEIIWYINISKFNKFTKITYSVCLCHTHTHIYRHTDDLVTIN
jgi:hypothetical protein